MMSTIRPSRIWVWVVAIAVALAAVASCFGPQTAHDYYDRGVARFKDDKNKGAFELPLHRLMFRSPSRPASYFSPWNTAKATHSQLKKAAAGNYHNLSPDFLHLV